MIKELIGECKRYKEDKIVNATPVTRLALKSSPVYASNGSNSLQFEQTNLAEVVVGDIIKVKDGEAVPTDCVLLSVEDNKPECFVKTSALDGERNLKPKLNNLEISKNFEQLFHPKANSDTPLVSLNCISPIKDLYYFEGRLSVHYPGQAAPKSYNLDLN